MIVLSAIYPIPIPLLVNVVNKKLSLPGPLSEFLDQQLKQNEIDVFVPTTKHFETVSNLPLHYRDPFDRLIVAQAMTEGIPVISVDTASDFDDIQQRTSINCHFYHC